MTGKERITERDLYLKANLQTRADDKGEKYLEGYFAKFNSITELWPGAKESINAGAFTNSLKNNDIRCLYNHDTSQVLGRKSSGTLELKEDGIGLWGRVKINDKDTDALNVYHKVERQDIKGCSIGFNIIDEDVDYKSDGTVKWTIKEADLHEVSICVFPAYEDTTIQARKKDIEIVKRSKPQEKTKTRTSPKTEPKEPKKPKMPLTIDEQIRLAAKKEELRKRIEKMRRG